MKVYKSLYCPTCKYRKDIATEPRNLVCPKCGSANISLSDWAIRWEKDGQTFKKVIGPNKKEAEDARRAALDGKEYIRLSRKVPVVLAAAADQYLDHCRHQAGSGNKAHHLNHYKRLWGRRPLYEIPIEAIKAEHNRLSNEKSPSTANRYLATLKALFTFAENNGHIDYMVLHSIRKVKPFEESTGRQRYLTVKEYKRLTEAARLSPCQDLNDIINFAIFTGLRQANVLGCRHDRHIDMENGLLKYSAAEVKGKRPLVIPISNMIEDMIRRRPRGISTPYLFFKDDGPYSRFQIDHYFGKVIEAAKIKDFRFHDLRHTLASWLAMSGSNAKHIQEILGHADMRTSQRYTHLAADHKKAAIGAVEDILLGGG